VTATAKESDTDSGFAASSCGKAPPFQPRPSRPGLALLQQPRRDGLRAVSRRSRLSSGDGPQAGLSALKCPKSRPRPSRPGLARYCRDAPVGRLLQHVDNIPPETAHRAVSTNAECPISRERLRLSPAGVKSAGESSQLHSDQYRGGAGKIRPA